MRSYMRYLEGHQVWRYIYDMVTLRLQTVFCPVQKVSWDDKLNLFDISVSYEIFLTLCCVLCTLLALSRGVLLCWPLMGITWSDHGLWILSGVFSICLVSVWWFRFCLYDNCACQWTTAVWLDVGSLRFGVINLVFELPQSKPKQWTHLSTLHNYNLGLITVYDLCSICQSWHPSFETPTLPTLGEGAATPWRFWSYNFRCRCA